MTETPAIKKGHEVLVTSVPQCDLCADGTPASHDARLPRYGSWGNVCPEHFNGEGCTTGVGAGQRYVLACSDHFVGAEKLRCETCGWDAATNRYEETS